MNTIPNRFDAIDGPSRSRRSCVARTKAAILTCLAGMLFGMPGPRLSSAAEPAREMSRLRPHYLRCEYRLNPLGIAVPKPRLSWLLETDERGQGQTAYQVQVASSMERLAKGQADLWDSGKVTGTDPTSVEYAGKPLRSGQPCYWKVRVWDKQDRPSVWSEVAHWSMGLLKPQDWQAQWIGYDAPRAPKTEPADFGPAKWIWFSGDKDKQPNFPKGTRVFLSVLKLPADAQIEKAELLVTADDRVWFNINGAMVLVTEPVADTWRHPRKADITGRLKPGDNTIRVQVENAQPGPAGLLARMTVKLKDGRTITHVTDGSWRATDQPGANWHSRPIDPQSWPAALVLGPYGRLPWGKLELSTTHTPPAVYLRKEFKLTKPVVRATLYASALGWYEARLNGRGVHATYFDPGWTDYNKRVYYRTYDVTDLVRRGDNALGAVLSDGWYSGYIGWGHKREHYGSKPRFLGQLVVEFADGSTQVIATGPDWRASTGPILEADILMGETYDARKAMPGWDKPGFKMRGWAKVDVGAELHPVLQPHPGPPVVVVREFYPRQITEPKPGVYVVDLGQNFAGVVRLKVSGKAGQRIQLRHAERLNPDGTIYTLNLRTARATDVYICRGEGVETWSPRFTFHGFQYVEITGLDQPPSADTVVGLALSSDTPVVGEFACSDPMLNRLHRNIYWTQRANFIDIPTDCPQRDERLGWTGDAQVYIRTATLNTDVQAFFTKWLVDLEDAQRADGQFPMVAPLKVAGGDGGPAWADAGVICPWTIYEVYGDRRVLEEHYDAMQRFIAFCEKRSTPDLLPPKQFHCFGDWLNIRDDTPKDVIYTAYFAYSTRLTARAAEALGRPDEAARYRKLFERIRQAFNRAYVQADGRIKGDTQTDYVLALAFDLVEGERARQAAEHLVRKIRERDWHLSTGFIGTKDLMLVLAKIGRNDVAYRLIHNDTFPSWGFSIKHGATTIWERWDGWTPEKGFQDPGMNSFAHYSFGAVYQWMVENIGGIHNEDVAYRRIRIAPDPDGKLTWARVGYRSIRGWIRSAWKKEGGRLAMDVTIPPNTLATVVVPTADAGAVRESGQPVAQAPGVRVLRRENGRLVLEVQSGTYHFTTPYAG